MGWERGGGEGLRRGTGEVEFESGNDN